MMKQIPYGITDFSRIQKENYYYVDKTMFIEKIEMQPPYLFLIRPRRFGKSLTLAMLEAYYDVNHAEQFDELFGQLYIGQHPTKLHNQFLIMRFNFSEVSSNVNEVELSFKLHCCSKLKDFVFKYEDLLGKEIWDVLDEKIQEEPGAFLSAINSYATRKKNIRIYLLIDEYDNFTNTILSTYGTEFYRKATSHIIHRHRTHSGNKQPFKSGSGSGSGRFYHVKEATNKTFAMRCFPVKLRTVS